MRFLLDTNVLSEPIKPVPDAKLVRWLARYDADAAVSVLTLGEIVKGIQMLPTGKRRQKMEAWLADIEQWAAGRLVLVDATVMREWGVYCAKQSKHGRVLERHGQPAGGERFDTWFDAGFAQPRRFSGRAVRESLGMKCKDVALAKRSVLRCNRLAERNGLPFCTLVTPRTTRCPISRPFAPSATTSVASAR